MKKFWLHSLLKVYAVIMVAIVGCLGIILSYSGWQSRYNETKQIAQRAATRLADEVDYYNRRANQLAQSLIENQAKLDGIYNYFIMSPSEYASWRLSANVPTYVQVSLHKNINDIYIENEFIMGIDIALNDYKTVFVSTRQARGGMQLPAEEFRPAREAFPIAIYDKTVDQVIGTIYIRIDEEVFNKVVDNTRGDVPLALSVISPYKKEILHFGDTKGIGQDDWIKKETIYNYTIQTAVPAHYVIEKTVFSTGLIIFSGLILVGVLYAALQRIFLNYQRQVVDIVDTLHLITDGDNQKRIATETKEQELLLIATTTNTMLDSLDKSIRDIYRLEISQKDANMRALQAQINPHFMYNTLEFIRMYAVMQRQEELADIIYEFSSLLRNNISDESRSSLKNELEFCRKYSYLCMVRHPKSVAYGFKIEEGLEEMMIPKFSIQPLIENYFVHGIDYRRQDNVISVKAQKIDGAVRLMIQDNGRGIPADRLAEIQDILASRELMDTQNREQQRSIGIRNIHERFLLFFGGRYSIRLKSQQDQGVTYIIEIKDE